MIGLLAGLQCPDRIGAQVMVGPSPSYINDGDYFGGFDRSDIEQLLETLEANYLGWSSNMAPVIMGAPASSSNFVSRSCKAQNFFSMARRSGVTIFGN